MLDTNVLVSGLLQPQGNPAHVVALVLAGAIEVCHDERILAEYAEVLARPRFQFDPARVDEILTKLALDGIAVEVADQSFGLPDEDDEPFLGVALATGADYLVTGNLRDYPAEKRRGCAVVSPAEFLAAWRNIHPDGPDTT